MGLHRNFAERASPWPAILPKAMARASKGEYKSFVRMARGSVLEIQTQLVIAHELGFGDRAKLSISSRLAEEIGKMLWAMLQKM